MIEAIIAAVCALVIGFVTGKKWALRRRPVPKASEVISESEMAVTEFEIIEAFSPFHLPEELFDAPEGSELAAA